MMVIWATAVIHSASRKINTNHTRYEKGSRQFRLIFQKYERNQAKTRNWRAGSELHNLSNVIHEFIEFVFLQNEDVFKVSLHVFSIIKFALKPIKEKAFWINITLPRWTHPLEFFTGTSSNSNLPPWCWLTRYLVNCQTIPEWIHHIESPTAYA